MMHLLTPERVSEEPHSSLDTPCWIWQKSLTSDGYAQAKIDGRKMRLHRVLYQIMVAEIPSSLVLDHLCERRPCINPYHLDPVTVLVNTMRGRRYR